MDSDDEKAPARKGDSKRDGRPGDARDPSRSEKRRRAAGDDFMDRLPTDPSAPGRAAWENDPETARGESEANDAGSGEASMEDARLDPDLSIDPGSDRPGPADREAADRIPTDPSVSVSSAGGAPGIGSGGGSRSAGRAGSRGSAGAAASGQSGHQQRPPTALDRASGRRERSRVEINTDAKAPISPDAVANDPSKDEHCGKIFGGKYRIEKLLAKGGMGRVYRATQFPLERPVAIKILNKEFQRSDSQFVRRFFLEASTAARLSHPHMITVFDYGESETNDLYIAMELLKGRPLSRVIAADGAFHAERALRISIQICRAVREAHLIGIIHRDLKPGNVFLVDEGDEADYVKVLDFGLVKLFKLEEGADKDQAGMLGEGDFELTRTGTLLGSPKYMSPEQIQGHHLDPRTDIYSFGVILFQMISGKPPFTGSTGVDVIYKHVHQPVPSTASVAPDVDCPAPVEAIIQRCLMKSRTDRFASMDDLLVNLKEAMRLITGASTSADSVAEGAATLKPLPQPVRSPRPGSIVPSRVEPAVSASAPTQEAGFRDPLLVDDPTPMGHLATDRAGEASGPRPQAARSRVALGISAVVLALATLVYLTIVSPILETRSDPASRPPPKDLAPALPAAAAQATPAEVAVRFSSDPLGARVYEGANLLGTTPFSRTFAVTPGQARARELVFEQDGYKRQVRSILLDGATTALEAKLERAAAPDATTPAAEVEGSEGAEDAAGKDPRRSASTAQKKRRAPGPVTKPAKKDETPNRYRQNPY